MNVEVTSDANFIYVEMNDLFLGGFVEFSRGKYRKVDMSYVRIENGYVEVNMAHENRVWQLSLTGENKTLPIETVGGVAPADLDALQAAMEALMV